MRHGIIESYITNTITTKEPVFDDSLFWTELVMGENDGFTTNRTGCAIIDNEVWTFGPSNGVSVFDESDGSHLEDFTCSEAVPNGYWAFNPDNRSVYIKNSSSGQIKSIDVDTRVITNHGSVVSSTASRGMTFDYQNNLIISYATHPRNLRAYRVSDWTQLGFNPTSYWGSGTYNISLVKGTTWFLAVGNISGNSSRLVTTNDDYSIWTRDVPSPALKVPSPYTRIPLGFDIAASGQYAWTCLNPSYAGTNARYIWKVDLTQV